MRPGPKKPGESAAEYSARVKAMEQKWMSGMGRPKTGGGKMIANNPMTKMKRGGTVKGKK